MLPGALIEPSANTAQALAPAIRRRRKHRGPLSAQQVSDGGDAQFDGTFTDVAEPSTSCEVTGGVILPASPAGWRERARPRSR
jgi:hypothetical protein